MKAVRCLIFAAAFAALAGCSSSDVPPVGTGYKTDEYKVSPCACIEVPQPAPTPGYLRRLGLRLAV